jgi:hypothetical protein
VDGIIHIILVNNEEANKKFKDGILNVYTTNINPLFFLLYYDDIKMKSEKSICHKY